ncbi:MAG: hypothetical protein ABIN58_05365, partial [candidate division WOR-3 bacterium]
LKEACPRPGQPDQKESVPNPGTPRRPDGRNQTVMVEVCYPLIRNPILGVSGFLAARVEAGSLSHNSPRKYGVILLRSYGHRL